MMLLIDFVNGSMGVSFEQFLKDKYDNPNGIHHYEITKTSGDTSEVINIGIQIKLHIQRM